MKVGWTLSLAMADPQTAGGSTIPFSNMTLTPQSPTLVDSSGTSALSLTVGSSGALTGTDTTPGTTVSSAYSVLTAPANQGMGSYTQPITLGLTVPAASKTGTYTSSLVISAQ